MKNGDPYKSSRIRSDMQISEVLGYEPNGSIKTNSSSRGAISVLIFEISGDCPSAKVPSNTSWSPGPTSEFRDGIPICCWVRDTSSAADGEKDYQG